MRMSPMMLGAALIGSALSAWAQVGTAPGAVCVVPPENAAMTTTTTTVAAATTTMPMTGATIPVTGAVATTPGTVMVAGTSCPANVSPETACLLNEISLLRSEVNATRGEVLSASLVQQGQQLVSRMDQLSASEMMFRQQLLANPNLPNAQLQASMLREQAIVLNRDIAAYNQSINAIPVSQRPFVASRLSSFQQAYWTPALQRFSTYQAQLTTTTYQPAYAANPWLQTWVTDYQASLNSVATSGQQFAQVVPTMTVAGTMETFPTTGTMSVPAGSTIMMPDGTVMTVPSNMTMSMSTARVAGTTETLPGTGTTTTPPATGTDTTGTTTTPPAAGTDTDADTY